MKTKIQSFCIFHPLWEFIIKFKFVFIFKFHALIRHVLKLTFSGPVCGQRPLSQTCGFACGQGYLSQTCGFACGQRPFSQTCGFACGQGSL